VIGLAPGRLVKSPVSMIVSPPPEFSASCSAAAMLRLSAPLSG